MTRILALLAATLLLFPLPTLAQDATPEDTPAPLPEMAEIEQAWQRGDYVFVRQNLKRHAEETGAALAQYRYGRVLLEGRGGPVDAQTASQWLELAVGQNHLEAATLLARVYLSGIEGGPARDINRAAELLSDAAARGNAEAQYYLALLHRSGEGVAKDAQASFTWIRAAAEQGYTEAQYELSRLYSSGSGASPDMAQAEYWLREAAEAGHIQAQFFLAQILARRNPAPAEALEWMRRAAEAGLPIAQRELGMIYLTGIGVSPNPAEALRWLTAAAEAGDTGAESNLGYAYASGTGVVRDDAKAAHWYERASDAGLGRATLALARFYETGRGVPQDMEKALTLYRTAAGQATPGAVERLGQLAASGALDGKIAPQRALPWAAAAAKAGDAEALSWLEAQAKTMPATGLYLGLLLLENGEDPSGAAAWLEKAAQAGEAEAQFQLGTLYTTGTGVELDYIHAHTWLNIAAARGHTKAAETRETISNLMTPDQVAKAQQAARDWFDTSEPQPPSTVSEAE